MPKITLWLYSNAHIIWIGEFEQKLFMIKANNIDYAHELP